jgi:hypothetical protein
MRRCKFQLAAAVRFVGDNEMRKTRDVKRDERALKLRRDSVVGWAGVGRTEYRSAWLCYDAPPHGPSYLRSAEPVVPEVRENFVAPTIPLRRASEFGCSAPAFKELRPDAEVKRCGQ